MSKPTDVPDDVWNIAGQTVNLQGMAATSILIEPVARAIMAERERCAKVADVYAEVNWQSCSDSILLDPVLSNRGERTLTKEDWVRAENMAVDGTIHSSMYHASTNIAAAIRGQQ